MAAPIRSPAKREVRSVIWFLNARGEHPVEIHKQIVAVCADVMNRQNVTKRWRESSERRTDVHDEQRSGRPSSISDDLLQKTEEDIHATRCGTIKRFVSHSSRSVRDHNLWSCDRKLRYRKLCACWVPKMLMGDHKTKRMGSVLKFFVLHHTIRTSQFSLVSSPKETSRWEKVWRRRWGVRRSHDVVQRAGSTLHWLGGTEAGSKTLINVWTMVYRYYISLEIKHAWALKVVIISSTFCNM
jgi:hypothetical protein